ncbi:MAG: hypothetical protein KDD69_13725, partial [Bdellovibrionales bacterium]|nr:hypothetical protein [Bdellovibrionales bacterium]
ITDRDMAIVGTLHRKVRVLSLDQIARHWWPDAKNPQQAARPRLDKLVDGGWIVCVRPQARGLPPLDVPVATWKPDTPCPDFNAVSSHLRNRWTAPTKGVQAYVLGNTAARYFGASKRGKLKYDFQASHDLGVAEVYLNLLETRPEVARRWIGEDDLAPFRKHEKIPDAVIADGPQSRPELVLEFGGSYSARRVQEFHEDCASQLLPYELW